MKSLGVLGFLGVLAACVASTEAATLYVGLTGNDPSGNPKHRRIQNAINVASNGDTILVDAGTYSGVAATMLFDGPSNITVKGVGGRPVLDMGTDHAVSVQGKGICLVASRSCNITLDNLEFQNAACRDISPWNDTSHNGAGIRWDGGGMLRVVNCVIHDCEDGILGTTTQGGDFLLENSVLYNNGSIAASNGTHNVYLGGGGEGAINSATVQYCWVYNAKVAHDLKITARVIKILYNRLGDEIITPGDPYSSPPTVVTGGGKGDALDMPHGGLAYVIGNLFIKGYTSLDANYSGNVIRYFEENPIFASYSRQLYVMYNTFLGQRTATNHFTIIDTDASPAWIGNNAYIKYNSGDFIAEGQYWIDPRVFTNSNFSTYEHQGNPDIDPGMVNYKGFPVPVTSEAIDVHLTATSPSIGKAVIPGVTIPTLIPAEAGDSSKPELGTFPLTPNKHYVHCGGTPMSPPPAMPSAANRNSATDVGMYNFNNPAGTQAPTVTAGGSAVPMGKTYTNRAVATVNGLLMGAASDYNSVPNMTLAWSMASGPAGGNVTFNPSNAAVTMANFSVAGPYTLRLTATDGTKSASADVKVWAEQAPVSTGNSTYSATLSGGTATVSLSATATDDGLPTGSTLTYTWSEVFRTDPIDYPQFCLSGPGISWPGMPTFTTGNPSTATFSYPGTFKVRLDVGDGALTSTKYVTVTVTDNLAGDINHDGHVNVGDLQLLVAAWNTTGSGLAADINGDSVVNVADLQAMIPNWGL